MLFCHILHVLLVVVVGTSAEGQPIASKTRTAKQPTVFMLIHVEVEADLTEVSSESVFFWPPSTPYGTFPPERHLELFLISGASLLAYTYFQVSLALRRIYVYVLVPSRDSVFPG